MELKRLLLVGAMASLVLAPAAAMAEKSMSSEQKKEVEKIVHDYLVSNPEVLMEASQSLQQKQQKSIQDQAKAAIFENAKQLFSGNETVIGNKKGNVTVVEFFDYQCIHCKKMDSIVDGLVKKDKNLRVIYKEFPIFGKSSEVASQAALAAGMQGKYQQMHDALIKLDQHLDEALVMKAAKDLGLNMAKLEKDMASKEVAAELDATRELAEKMHLMGTPAFVVASTPAGNFNAKSDPTFIPGAATEEILKNLISKANAG